MRRISVLVSVGAIVALLTGCAASTPDLAPDVATTLQNQVVLVAEGAASGDHQSALDTLDDLQSDLDEAESASTVQPDRVEQIQSAIDLVRADLETLVAADAAAEEAAAVAAEEAAKVAEEAEKAANTPAPEESTGPGNSGKGKDKGKGKNKG